MKRFALVALIASLVGLNAEAFAQGPAYFSIRDIIHAGTGCPAGSVAENVSLDYSAFTLLFDSFVAEAGPGIPLSASRKNCQLAITFDCPVGWQFALIQLDARGFSSLDPGVSGVQTTSFYFQGDARTGRFNQNFYGPSSEDYHVRADLPVSQRIYGVCGRALNINTSVRVDNMRNRFGSGLMTVDSVDGSVAEVYQIVWQRQPGF
jgi:hypothetical protein